jgi:hypothetical protein
MPSDVPMRSRPSSNSFMRPSRPNCRQSKKPPKPPSSKPISHARSRRERLKLLANEKKPRWLRLRLRKRHKMT